MGVGTSQARFNNPRGIAIDASGTIYAGDTGNNAIRKITPDGTVTTLSGELPTGQLRATAASSGRLFSFGCFGGAITIAPGGTTMYVADSGSNTIKTVTPSGEVRTVVGSGDPAASDGSAGQASFRAPQGVALDKEGRLVIADTANHTIRKTTPVATSTPKKRRAVNR